MPPRVFSRYCVLGVWIGLALLSAPASAADWRVVQDPHGFSVSLPADWSTRVLGNGSVVIGPGVENILGPQAWVYVMHLEKERSSAEVARSLASSFTAVVNGATAVGPHQLQGDLSDSCSMRGSFPLLDKTWNYVFLVSAKGRVATLTGFSAPADRFEGLKPAFTRVLASFKLDPKLRDPKRIAPPSPEWVDWKDSKEGAFSMQIPKGWTVEGGIVRPYIDAWGAVVCKKGGKNSTSFSFYTPAPPLFTEPNSLMTSLGFVEGSPYNPSGGVAQSMIVMQYPGPRAYVRKWLLPQVLKPYPDAQIAAYVDRPDFASASPKSSFIQTSAEGGEAELTATVDGVKVLGRVYILLTRMVLPRQGGLWHATLGLVTAPPAEFDQALDVFWRTRDSFVVNPQWIAEEARQVMARSKIQAGAAADISKTIRDTYETRARSTDEIGRRWSNAMLGQVDLADPRTGDVRYGVPSGANHYWEVGGAVVGTNTYTSPAVGATELKDLDDLIRR